MPPTIFPRPRTAAAKIVLSLTHLRSHILRRHASLLRRPTRPYTFTQLLTLSDGSTCIQRTTSPLPIYKTAKDTRNNPLWNPSSQRLANVEEDEAGRLKAFRLKFGRGWDAEAADEEDGVEGAEMGEKEDGLMDLISGFGGSREGDGSAGSAEGKDTKEKGEGKRKTGKK